MNELLPPAVPVPLPELLSDPALGLRHRAGPAADVAVYAVHTSEMADPVPYLLGGELLLSAGVHTAPTAAGSADQDGARWDAYAARTVEAGAAALGFGVAPVHDTLPRALVDACDRHGLPLLEVPRTTTFTEVAQAVWRVMAERRHRDLRRAAEAQQALAVAAGGPGPVAAVLRQLARHLDGWVVLLGPDGAEYADAGARPGPDARAALAALAGRLRPGPSSAATALPGYGVHLSAFAPAAPGGAGSRLALGICAPRRDPVDDAVAQVAAVLLTLVGADRTVTADADRSAALVRLMLGADPAEAGPLLAGTDTTEHGRHGERDKYGEYGEYGEQETRWTVVHGRRRGTARVGARFAGAELAAGLGTSLVDLAGDGRSFRALVPGARPVEAQPGWTIGAGEPVPAGELVRGDAGAARALRRALAGQVPLVRQRPGTGMAALVAPEEARAHSRARLAPLAGSPALVETLRVWLSLHGSWDRTAVALGIHRNTVRQRVARVARLLGGEDLGDPDVRMELWFALAWHEPDGDRGCS